MTELKSFSDQHELLRFARDFLEERTASLQRDVAHCLAHEPYAPFPALLYCFATVDLLGALSFGDASRNAKTSQNAASYMRCFMHYPEDLVVGPSAPLSQIFRHKLVHLAQPMPCLEFDGMKLTWQYHHDDPGMHLQIVPISTPRDVSVTTKLKPHPTHVLHFCITKFAKDICDSVLAPAGYLHRLHDCVDLQNKFDTAVRQMHDHSQK